MCKRRYETQQVKEKGACRAVSDYAVNVASLQRAVCRGCLTMLARVLDNAAYAKTGLILLPTQRLDRRNESDENFHRAQL